MDDTARSNRKVTRRQLGITVVAIIVLVILGLAYAYSTAAYYGTQMITVAVRGTLPAKQRQALLLLFEGYSETEDGKIQLNLIEFPEQENDPATKILADRLMTEIQNGKSDLFVTDDYAFGLITDDTIFSDLGTRFPNDPAVVDLRRYALEVTAFWNVDALKNSLPLFLSIRDGELPIVKKNAHTLGRYAYQSLLLENIVMATPPEDFIVTHAGLPGNAYPFIVDRYFTV